MARASRQPETDRGRGATRTPGRGEAEPADDQEPEPSAEPAPSRSRRPWPSRLVASPKRRVLLALVGTLVVSSFLVWLLYGSPWLRVERVSVTGTQALSDRHVSAVADISEGTPLASVDKDAVEERLRSTLPRIAEAEVVRAWPSGISLKVTEREPVLVMERAGKYVEMDSAGVRFATVAKRPDGVPLLAFEPDRSEAARYFSAKTLRRAAATTTAALPEPVRRDARTVTVGSYDSITVQLSGGRTVRWGSAERPEAKAKSLTALMKAAKDAEHFDVSVPSAPAAAAS